MNETMPSVLNRRSLFIWVLCCVLGGGVLVAYALAARAAGHGEYVMPLDDVYIHFQYARQLAAGQPYQYNPGLPPTSGATSFLYPYLLALGVLLGFTDLNLGIWAMSLGALALIGAGWLVYQIGLRWVPWWMAALGMAAFMLNGPVSWHFMSGMETGCVTFALLLLLWALLEDRFGWCIGAAGALVLLRPEMGLLALMAVVFIGWQSLRQRRLKRRLPWLLLPFVAYTLQPTINFLLTGSFAASGSQAKSLFGIVPAYPDVIWGRIFENFTRFGQELVTGISQREGLYLPIIITLVGLFGLGLLISRRQTRLTGLLIALWLIVGALLISTLDTAFWHFKRYQMPLLALLFPLALIGLSRLPRRLAGGLIALSVVFTLLTTGVFLGHFSLNSSYVFAQPLTMARWLRVNTPEDAVVAVHDTGMMRYMGGRTTVDMVGLTTPGAAWAWRHGPGAVGEFLVDQRPDYIAAYGREHGLGLSYLADTDLYGEPLITFPVELDPSFNVALAAPVQGIYQPDWETADRAENGRLSVGIQQYVVNDDPITTVDPAQSPLGPLDPIPHHNQVFLRSWARYDDFEALDNRMQGFVTEYLELPVIGCFGECLVGDGTRRGAVVETFGLLLPPLATDSPLVLVSRVHAAGSGEISVYVNETLIGTRVVFMQPGYWQDIPTRIPPEISSYWMMKVRLIANFAPGDYQPAHHWLYLAGEHPLPDAVPFSTFQEGAFWLYPPDIRQEPDWLHLDLIWGTDGAAQGDAKVFVHLSNDQNEIVAQADMRPGSGGLPPGNWLSGALRDTISVDVSAVPPGHYHLWMGLYDPVTQARLMPSNGDANGRIDLGEVELKPHADG